MATLNNIEAEIAEQVLTDLTCIYASVDKIRTIKAYDREHGQFLLLDEGWEGYQRSYHVWAHIELRDGKFWIQEDGTEKGIANLLLAKGVPKNAIVLAFHALDLRQSSDFAAA